MSGEQQGAAAAFAREVGRAGAAVAVTLVSLVFLSSSVVWFVEDVEEWWQWLVAGALALAVAAAALTAIARTVGELVAQAAAGWVGLRLRRMPRSFTRHVGPRALANAVVLLVAGSAGLAVFRLGAARGELHWSTEGLLLALAGVLFGLVPLVPRLALLRASRAGRPIKVVDDPRTGAKDPLLAFVLATFLGLGLSMGVSHGFASVRGRVPRALETDAWVEGRLVDRPGLSWPRRAALPLPTVAAPGLLRLEVELAGCTARLNGAALSEGRHTVELGPAHVEVTIEPTSPEPASYRARVVAVDQGAR